MKTRNRYLLFRKSELQDKTHQKKQIGVSILLKEKCSMGEDNNHKHIDKKTRYNQHNETKTTGLKRLEKHHHHPTIKSTLIWWKNSKWPSLLACSCRSSTQEPEPGRSLRVQGQPGLHREVMWDLNCIGAYIEFKTDLNCIVKPYHKNRYRYWIKALNKWTEHIST